MNLKNIPEHMHDAITRYVMDGIHPGSFLKAILTNDLKEAYIRADDINRKRIEDWAFFVIWEVPESCQGSELHFNTWMQRGGLNGIRKEEDTI